MKTNILRNAGKSARRTLTGALIAGAGAVGLYSGYANAQEAEAPYAQPNAQPNPTYVQPEFSLPVYEENARKLQMQKKESIREKISKDYLGNVIRQFNNSTEDGEFTISEQKRVYDSLSETKFNIGGSTSRLHYLLNINLIGADVGKPELQNEFEKLGLDINVERRVSIGELLCATLPFVIAFSLSLKKT